MRSILNNNLLRQLNFLEILYNEEDWISIVRVAKSLQCSEKILRNDIKLINEEFSPFEIKTSLKGIKLTYPINYSSEYIYQKFLSLSPEFLFLERIFFEESLTVETIAEELFISVSTLRRIIKKINITLNGFGIIVTTNPCRITGNEGSIQNFFVNLFYEKYGVTNIPFTHKQIKILDQLLIYVTEKNNIKINFPNFNRLRYWMMVNIVRIRKGNAISIEEELPNSVNMEILNNKCFCHIFKSVFHFELNKESAYQVLYIFLSNKYVFSYEQLENMMNTKTGNTQIVVSNIKTFLYKISNKLDIPIKNVETITVELYNLHNLYFGPKYVLNENRKLFSEYANHEFSYFIQIIKKELQQLKFHDTFEWEKDFLNETLYILITHWTNFSNILANKIGRIKVGLFCDSDIEHTIWIREIMKYQFGHHVQMHIIDKLSIASFKEDALKYDLIITNISGVQNITVPIVCIDTIPYFNDFGKIQKVIYKLLKEKR
ncbi:helix-turn-helix domain-containing protein [Bacillus cereus]|nr:helix-turn-helix domain-containing protein [Bacillus cereus]